MRVFASIFSLVLCGSALAQPYPRVPAPPPPPQYAPGPDLPRMLTALTDQPATHSGFVFDRTALQFAQGLLAAQAGIEQGRAAAALTGIQVDRYSFQQPAFYTPEAMSALIDGYHAMGWKHLVNGNQTPANTAQPKQLATDLWLHFSGADIDGVTVLTRGAKDMNVVRISGDLRPLDLLKLSGHFGIPKVDPSAVMVPAPGGS